MIRWHEEEEEEKRRQTEGMSAGDEYRMMLLMAEKHAREMSEQREMVEEETQKGRKEAREKVVVDMVEMIEKGYGNVTSGVKESGREIILNVKRENWKREHGGQEVKTRKRKDWRRGIEYCRGIWRRQTGTKKKKRIWGAAVEIDRGGITTQEMVEAAAALVAAVEEEIDRDEMTTQEMVAAVAAAELEDRRRCDNEAGEQALLEQLLQDNGMEENCGKQKNEEEQHERDEMQEESLQSKAKEAADCVVQAQKKEMSEAGREGGVKTHEESVPEVGQPYFVVSKWEEESGGACGGDQAAVRRGKLKGYEESASVHMTRKDMDALLRKVKQLSEMVENAGELLSEVWNERRKERNEGVNPEEVVEDDAMDWEWAKRK